MGMRPAKTIYPCAQDDTCGSLAPVDNSGGNPDSINHQITIEILLDIRRELMMLIMQNEGETFTVTGWMENIADGK